MDTTTLQAELTGLQSRQATLLRSLQEAENELHTLRESVLDGSAPAGPKLHAATAKRDSLDGLCREIQERVTAKRAELATAQAADSERERRAKAGTHLADLAGHLTEIDAESRALEQHIITAMQSILSHVDA